MRTMRRQFGRALVALGWLTVVGCHRLPFHRVDPSLDPRAVTAGQRPSPARLTLADETAGVPLPALPLRPVSDREALGAAESTPLLDAALARAQAEQDSLLAESSRPTQAVEEPPPPATDPGPHETPIRPRLEPVPESASPAVVETPSELPPPRPETEPRPDSVPPEEVVPEPGNQTSDQDAEPALSSGADTQPAFTIGEIHLCRRVLGFGKFESIEGPLRAGQVAVLYCELIGLVQEPYAEGYRSQVEATVELRAVETDQVLWRRNLGMAEDRCRRPRQDYYVNYRLSLPTQESLPAGRYRLVLTQRDRLGEREARGELELSLSPGNR